MKHLKHYIHPIAFNSAIAIISMIGGGLCYKYNQNITDFEVILIAICTFIGIKGITNFVCNMYYQAVIEESTDFTW